MCEELGNGKKYKIYLNGIWYDFRIKIVWFLSALIFYIKKFGPIILEVVFDTIFSYMKCERNYSATKSISFNNIREKCLNISKKIRFIQNQSQIHWNESTKEVSYRPWNLFGSYSKLITRLGNVRLFFAGDT